MAGTTDAMAAVPAPACNGDESHSSAQEIFIAKVSSALEPVNWGASCRGTSEKKKNTLSAPVRVGDVDAHSPRAG